MRNNYENRKGVGNNILKYYLNYDSCINEGHRLNVS